MEGKLQQKVAFFLTGRRVRSDLLPMDGKFRPALFARYGDLSSLRYDFPLVLGESPLDRAVLSLSRLVDDAVDALAEDPDRDRIARHGFRLELEVRRELAIAGPGDFATLWHTAASRGAAEGDETIQDSAKRLWTAFRVDGGLFDADQALPARVVRHAWKTIQAGKAEAFRQKAERLLLKLRGILETEMAGSAVGRMPQRLKAGVGASFASSFDFDAMSRILIEAKPGIALSDERRGRIIGLIDVLEQQRFYPLGHDVSECYDFSFSKSSDALRSFQERHGEAVELAKALAIAELEANGEYRESIHDVLFEGFGANGLDAGQLAELPNYLVCTNASTMDAAETAQLVDLLAAGLPIKVLVQTDDVLEPSTIAEGHVSLGLRARQLVDTAIGLTDVFVFQTSSSHLFQKRESLTRGLEYDGPALFSVFSGANGHTGDVPAYLVAAAAMESRVFPALVFDPSAGSDWATRLSVDDNPRCDDDWPVHTFVYEDEKLQARTEPLAFTPADFMAMDDRFFGHFAIVPQAEWSDALIPVPEALQTDADGIPSQVPCITLVDDAGRLQRAILDDRTLGETRRCLSMWHSLQELGGIHNSHAQRMLARQQKAEQSTVAAPSSNTADVPAPPAEPVPAPVAAEPARSSTESLPDLEAETGHGDDPYIETARCTTCNECTNLNNRMFSYNAEKQAYIADPSAGTYRQLVEAAEGCQVSIIHPGKPRNLKEPGLDDLIRRAAEFN